MKNFKKATLLLVCALLLVGASVFGTYAYLTSTDKVLNTFTVGDVAIKLHETEVNEMGESLGTITEDGNEYHLLPGHTYVKDPTVTVLADSEDSYVRVLVKVTEIANLATALPEYNTGNVFLLEKLVKDWDSSKWVMTSYELDNTTGTGIYEFRYHEVVAKDDVDTELVPVFTEVVIPGSIDNGHLAWLEGVNVEIVAQAIQKDGFTTADAAWENVSK